MVAPKQDIILRHAVERWELRNVSLGVELLAKNVEQENDLRSQRKQARESGAIFKTTEPAVW